MSRKCLYSERRSMRGTGVPVYVFWWHSAYRSQQIPFPAGAEQMIARSK